ncbi:hypothetical protein BCR41DRAFT_373126 [Lobosporangium transversale]|uniref:Uncharacterized protein n=1 Tax=Lobosporangium transversale TaxID=64571 RepID=A0A1Y2GGG7_9FUNG|nr:hypothetical protein BCR41DRAFT_373126 [Lobosporangium transversale]ORZ08826.1 hypothetical protein BCR41DRAFT_373126 [Lobosporangium transversale]|eukprot:XP_021878609.1 hypothetical protein BCR41DRAFT_373126 [Lobosporangium transversale]
MAPQDLTQRDNNAMHRGLPASWDHALPLQLHLEYVSVPLLSHSLTHQLSASPLEGLASASRLHSQMMSSMLGIQPSNRIFLRTPLPLALALNALQMQSLQVSLGLLDSGPPLVRCRYQSHNHCLRGNMSTGIIEKERAGQSQIQLPFQFPFLLQPPSLHQVQRKVVVDFHEQALKDLAGVQESGAWSDETLWAALAREYCRVRQRRCVTSTFH